MENLKRKIEKIQMLFTTNQMFRLVDKNRYSTIELELSEALKLCDRQEGYECDHYFPVARYPGGVGHYFQPCEFCGVTKE